MLLQARMLLSPFVALDKRKRLIATLLENRYVFHTLLLSEAVRLALRPWSRAWRLRASSMLTDRVIGGVWSRELTPTVE